MHLIAGLLAGLIVGVVAPRLIDALVRSEPMLLVALAVLMSEELPYLRGVAPSLAEPLGAQLVALLFVVVLTDLLLQPLLLRRLLPFKPETSPP